MRDTAIQWRDDTVNPVMGCDGCELAAPNVDPRDRICYTYIQHQFRGGNKGWARDFFQPELFPGRMAKAAVARDLTDTKRESKPWLDGMPRLIFVSDMGDALSNNATFEFLKDEIIDTVLGIAPSLTKAGKAHAPLHQWLWLTKRPSRILELDRWLRTEHRLDWPANLWIGTSVTSSTSFGRLDDLQKVGNDTTTRFISAEPLWEPVDLSPYLSTGHFHWVIAGGESRQRHKSPRAPKRFELNWARSIRDACKRSSVAFFLKQTGANVTTNDELFAVDDDHGGDWDAWPTDLRIRQLPTQWRNAANDRSAEKCVQSILNN